MAGLRAKLLDARKQRPQPGRDDKILADWNGLAISGLARAAQATGSPTRNDTPLNAFRFVSELDVATATVSPIPSWRARW